MNDILCSICKKPINKEYHIIQEDNLIMKNRTSNSVSLALYDVKEISGELVCDECYANYNKVKDNITLSENNLRPNKINYYLNIAKEVSTRSTCLRRKYGSILVKDDVIIATGYNGSPRGTMNCNDLGYCRREQLGVKRGEQLQLCRAVHSEQNCIINASREQMIGSILYLYGSEVSIGEIIENLDSCQMCKKLIINAGIEKVVFAKPNNQYEIRLVKDWILNDETLTDKLGY